MALGEFEWSLGVQFAPILFPGAVLAEPEVPDPYSDIQPVA